MKKTLSNFLPLYIPILFVTCVAILLVNGVSLIQNLQSLKQTNNMMLQTSRIIDHLQYINVLITDAESSTRGYFISGNKVYLGPLKTVKGEIVREFGELSNLLQENPQQLKNLFQLQTLFKKKLTILDQAISVYEEGGLSEIVQIGKIDDSRETMDEIRLLIIILVREAHDAQTARDARFYDEYQKAVFLGIAINAVAILVLILLYSLNRRNFLDRLKSETALYNLNENLEATVSARTAQLTILSRHLISVAEEEKVKLARELHDEMGASLTAINMDMVSVSEKIKGLDANLASRIQRARETLLNAIDLKRRIIENLRPSMLDNLGLSASIRSHCENFSHLSGVHCEVDIEEDFDKLDPLLMIAIFRITQESLTNIAKYAKATKVIVSLKREATNLRLQITDDGVGIPIDAVNKTRSFGLVGMRERALLLGGTFSVAVSANKRGTIVAALIPCVSSHGDEVMENS
ncbi:MAG: CHASE3 domain-containing protein [Pseudomonadota bacterium]